MKKYIKNYINKFYHLDKVTRNKAIERSFSQAVEFRKSLEHSCMNDNDVIRIIFGLGEKLSLLPNDLDVARNPNYPIEVKSVLDSLQREFPSGFLSCRDDDDVCKYISSRYAQFGGEVDDFVDSFSAEIRDMQARQEGGQHDEQVSNEE